MTFPKKIWQSETATLYTEILFFCFVKDKKVLLSQVYLLIGQGGLPVQFDCSVAEPAQVAPPALGAGLSQTLVLVLAPAPHVVLQAE